jgi:hypothetical protein
VNAIFHKENCQKNGFPETNEKGAKVLLEKQSSQFFVGKKRSSLGLPSYLQGIFTVATMVHQIFLQEVDHICTFWKIFKIHFAGQLQRDQVSKRNVV